MPTLEFKGKPFVYSHHLSVPFRELVVAANKSAPGGKTASLDDNLIIHGDNLEALKALLPRYAGKVDVIAIDPPYNTGNEGWSYNDNVNSPLMKAWLGRTVDKDDLERHDKWLCMMWPRLQLLRELLSENGSLWMTLDDNEAQHATVMLDEIFGEACRVAQIVWRSSDNSNNDSKGFSSDKNYILVYGKRPDWLPAKISDPDKRKHFKNPDNDPRGAHFDGNPVDSPNPRENLKYLLQTPSGQYIKPPKNGWRWSKDVLLGKIESGEIRFSPDESRIIRRTYLADMQGLPPSDLWIDLEKFGHNRNAKYELQSLFGGESPFQTPKPTKLIQAILDLASTKTSVVLDSFAGAGTTAHATLASNRADDGSRKFILIETEDYADTLTAERMRRVIAGVPDAKDDTLKKGLGGSFTYCELGAPIDLAKFFDGTGAPAYEQVARYVIYTATGASAADVPQEPRADWFVGEAGGHRLHLIYRPDLDFMRSNAAALSAPLARQIETAARGKPVLVFAAQKFMSQAELSQAGVTFCQLPYSVYRILGEAADAS